MWKLVAFLSAVLLLGLPVPQEQTKQEETKKNAQGTPPVEFKIPPEAAKQENPVKPTASSIAAGKKIYGYDCALCHGTDGDGQGDLAKDMNLKLRDYRDPTSLKTRTDGELYYIISKGKGEMTGEADRLKPDEIWNLVNYVRSFAKKEAPPGSKAPNPQ